MENTQFKTKVFYRENWETDLFEQYSNKYKIFSFEQKKIIRINSNKKKLFE